MKKKKIKYSMTAKERKLQRENELKKNEKPAKRTFEELSEEEQTAYLERENIRKHKKHILTKIVAITLVVILALGTITTGVILYVKVNTIDNMVDNPTATITIDNNGTIQKLEMDLYYKYAPAAVANFIYLSQSGFYDNTIFNATSGYQRFLAMSGFTSATTHRASDTNFVSELKGFADRTGIKMGTANFKLAYRIKRVENDPGLSARKGHIAFMGGKDTSTTTYATSTTFLILGESPILTVGTSGTNITDYLTYIGKLTDESIAIVDEINAITDVSTCKYTNWSYANIQNHPIKILNIKIGNLNRKLNKKIMNNFEEFVLTGEDGLGGLLQWASNNKTDGYFY